MRVKLFLLSVAYFLSTLDKSHATYKCYKALICIHDGKEKCGQDMTGKTRRFFDSCDMNEYNCLKDANFQKTNREKCRNLPPIDNRPSTNDKISNKNEVIEKKSKGIFIYDDEAKEASKGDGVDRESEENALDGENNLDDTNGENEVIEKKSKGIFIYDDEVKGASKGDGVDRESEENALDGENNLDDANGENEVIEKKSKGLFIYDDEAKGTSKGDGVDRESEENALDGENNLDDANGENEEEKFDDDDEGNQVTNEKEENETDEENKDVGNDAVDGANKELRYKQEITKKRGIYYDINPFHRK